MPRVIVNDAAPAEPGDLEIRVNRGARTFRLRSLPLFNPMVDQLRSRPLDLLLIAAAVFAADAQTGRGGEVREDVGAAWSREFRFVIPVLDAAFWRSNVGALVKALEFLTGDRFAFEFLHRERSERRQPSLALAGGIPRADEVVLFSGGLDSLTGAFESLTSDPAKTILLVTHRSGPKTAGVQTDLAQELEKKFPGQVLWVPVLGTLVNREARASETTQRSRSFLYAALGYGAASLVGTPRLLFYENGIVSANLPINHEVVGTMATRTTHSLFFQHMERLLSAIDQKAVAISNPYQPFTKAEVVERLVRLGGAELIGRTNSCSSVRPRTTEHPHCGCCSQCLDRRFAILAAGAEAHDPAGDYRMELWNGRRANYRERILAVDWTRHGRSLKKMSLVEFRTRFAAELTDLARAHPDQPVGTLMTAIFDLHRRHGEAVQRVLTRAIAENSAAAADGALPENSLIAAVFADAAEAAPARLRVPRVAEPDEELRVSSPGRGPVFPLRLVLVPSGKKVVLWVGGLGRFDGAHWALIEKLKPFHDAAVYSGLDHEYVKTRRLGPQSTTGQHASRCRAAVRVACSRKGVAVPSGEPLVQSRKHSGYRIDPVARFVDDLTELMD